jgi:hypothetical protein
LLYIIYFSIIVNKNIFFNNISSNINYDINSNNDIKNIIKEQKEKEECEKDINDNQPKKNFSIRPGDWYCGYCNNLNFSFRNFCNRCRLSKFYWN